MSTSKQSHLLKTHTLSLRTYSEAATPEQYEQLLHLYAKVLGAAFLSCMHLFYFDSDRRILLLESLADSFIL